MYTGQHSIGRQRVLPCSWCQHHPVARSLVTQCPQGVCSACMLPLLDAVKLACPLSAKPLTGDRNGCKKIQTPAWLYTQCRADCRCYAFCTAVNRFQDSSNAGWQNTVSRICQQSCGSCTLYPCPCKVDASVHQAAQAELFKSGVSFQLV